VLAQLLVLVLLLLLLLEGGMGMCVVVHGRGVVVLLLVLLVLLVLHDCGVVLIVAWVLGVVRLTVILLRSQGRRHRRQVLLLLLRWLSVCVWGGVDVVQNNWGLTLCMLVPFRVILWVLAPSRGDRRRELHRCHTPPRVYCACRRE